MTKKTKKTTKDTKYTVCASTINDANDVKASLAFQKIKTKLIDKKIMSEDEFESMCSAIGNEAVDIYLNEKLTKPGDIIIRDFVGEVGLTNTDEMVKAANNIMEALGNLAKALNSKSNLPWYKRLWNWICRK